MFDILLDYEIVLCIGEFSFTSSFAGAAVHKIVFSPTSQPTPASARA